jgi:hypothetical protein
MSSLFTKCIQFSAIGASLAGCARPVYQEIYFPLQDKSGQTYWVKGDLRTDDLGPIPPNTACPKPYACRITMQEPPIK